MVTPFYSAGGPSSSLHRCHLDVVHEGFNMAAIVALLNLLCLKLVRYEDEGWGGGGERRGWGEEGVGGERRGWGGEEGMEGEERRVGRRGGGEEGGERRGWGEEGVGRGGWGEEGGERRVGRGGWERGEGGGEERVEERRGWRRGEGGERRGWRRGEGGGEERVEERWTYIVYMTTCLGSGGVFAANPLSIPSSPSLPSSFPM